MQGADVSSTRAVALSATPSSPDGVFEQMVLRGFVGPLDADLRQQTCRQSGGT
jgi:hypothetical protein